MASLQRGLSEAKKLHKTVPVRVIKIIFTGSGASGKTSFRNLLMKKEINKAHHSTNVVQASHAISMRKAVALDASQTDEQDVVWLEMDRNTEMAHMIQLLSPANLDYESPSVVQRKSSRRNSTSGSSSINQHWHDTNRSSVGNWVYRLGSKKVKNIKLETLDSLVQASLQATTSHHLMNNVTQNSVEALHVITLLDTGGQPEYINLLPTVNLHPMVNFIIHDLSKSLEDQVLVEFSEQGKHVFKPYNLRYSNLEMIKFLMSTIKDSLERPSTQVLQLNKMPGKNNNSYLCCIGTHADLVGPEVIENIDNQLTTMVEKLDCKAAVWQNEKGGVLFSVDNTTAGDDKREDPIATYIRSQIDALASERDVFELPITWMLLEMEIRHVCSTNNKAYITFQECSSIALQSKLVTDEKEVENILLYHHFLGVLLFFHDVPGLCEFVIIDHQWLFDKLSKLVCFPFKCSANICALNTYKYSGVLTQNMLQELKWEGGIQEDHFIALLVKMRIIAPIKKDDSTGHDYFIPHVLPTYTSKAHCDSVLSQYGCLQGEPLLIHFVSNLLPRGFFCCLVVQILQHLPNGWSYSYTQKTGTYSNLITICLPNAYALSLIDKLFYLEVQVRHHRPDFYKEVYVHRSVWNVLEHALQTICKQLNFDYTRIQYGFCCQCEEIKEEHTAVLATLTPPFHYASCSYGSRKPTKLELAHVVWLTQKSACGAFEETKDDDPQSKEHELPEFRVLKEYYYKLANIVPASDLSHYFVSENLVTVRDHEEIINPVTSPQMAVLLLLNRVAHSLQTNSDVGVFSKMLAIMEYHGNSATKHLSLEIRARMLEETNKTTSNSTQQVIPDYTKELLQYSTNASPNIVSSADKFGCPSPEYSVFIEFYSKLVDILPAKELVPKFISCGIITAANGEEIMKDTTTSKRAATLLLNKVDNPLKTGICEVFYKLVHIISEHGNADIEALSLAMNKRLFYLKSGISNGTIV